MSLAHKTEEQKNAINLKEEEIETKYRAKVAKE